MGNIINRCIEIFDLQPVYLVEKDDSSTDVKKVLAEAFICEVSIQSDGNVKYKVQIAGEETPVDLSSTTLYESVADYKTNQPVKWKYGLVKDLLTEQLAVPESVMSQDKTYPNSSVVMTPQGFFLENESVVEEVEFPSPWMFTRELIGEENEDGETVLTGEISPWSHNANFNGCADSDISPTREALLSGKVLTVLKLDGSETAM